MNVKTRKMNAQFRALALTLIMLSCAAAGCLGIEQSDDDVIGSVPLETLVIAYEVRDDYTNVDENPQALADYLSEKLNYDVSIYNVNSEGAMIEALRFGNADIAIMDGGAAWVGWQQYNLQVLAADQKSDGRAFYNAHAWVLADSDIAAAHLDDDSSTDPFALLAGKTSCHTGWLKSAGMLLPMGYLIGKNYSNVVGDENNVDSLRDTIHGFFNENASIPDSGTPYYGYSGAVKCLSEGVGDVAFAKDSTIDSYCGNDNASNNEDWCLARDQYIALPAFGQAPSHPIMYNPEFMDISKSDKVRDALVEMTTDSSATPILEHILNTPGIISTNTEEHLGSYSSLISNVPGISEYYGSKFDITPE